MHGLLCAVQRFPIQNEENVKNHNMEEPVSDSADFRSEIRKMLVKDGYTIVESGCSPADPFEWYIIAKKDEYEVRIQERCASLL